MMRRGEIYFANLNPTVGSEIRKKRPVLIVSNNANNKESPTITIAPITSNIKNVFPFEVLLEKKDSGLPKPSKVLCQQVRAISKMRIVEGRVGLVNRDVMMRVNAALKLHLAI